MIIDFRFSNFRSFKDEARLCLDRDGSIDRPAQDVAAVYGANASGKTNVVHAIALFRGIVLSNARLNSADQIGYQPFLLDSCENEPYLTEVTFDLEGMVYRYGFEIASDGVRSEWLFTSKDIAAFRADEEDALFVFDGLDVTGSQSKAIRELLPRKRSNTLILTKLDQENDALAGKIICWFHDLVVVQAYNDPSFYQYSHNHLIADKTGGQLEFIRKADPTIVKFDEAQIGAADAKTGLVPTQIRFLRRSTAPGNGLVPLSFSDFESAGTQKMFCVSGPIMDILEHGRVVVFDEFESKLHPNLTRALVGYFTDPKRNPHAAQLIVTTHDVELMRAGVLTRSQVFFCDKNLHGESKLYSLANFIDSDQYDGKVLAEKYLEGIFGAIPPL